MVNDKTRYNTDDPNNDMPGLGENVKLAALNRMKIRQQLTFMDPQSFAERDRAVRILLERISQYYECIGYVGPYITGHRSEIGYALGGWIVEPRMAPWRESFACGQPILREQPDRVFSRVRYASFEIALQLAAWEIAQEVPESAESLKRAAWCAYSAITSLSNGHWPNIRNRLGTKGMKKQLAHVIKSLEHMELVQGSYWLGYYAPLQKAA